MSNNTNFFVTHIIVPEIPDHGFDQVFFYTSTRDSYDQGKYFWGTDNNSFDEDYVNSLVQKGEILPLDSGQNFLYIKDDETIWVDSFGELYIADLHEPIKNQRKLKQQSILKSKVANMVYHKSVENIKGWPPKISKATKVAESNKQALPSA